MNRKYKAVFLTFSFLISSVCLSQSGTPAYTSIEQTKIIVNELNKELERNPFVSNGTKELTQIEIREYSLVIYRYRYYNSKVDNLQLCDLSIHTTSLIDSTNIGKQQDGITIARKFRWGYALDCNKKETTSNYNEDYCFIRTSSNPFIDELYSQLKKTLFIASSKTQEDNLNDPYNLNINQKNGNVIKITRQKGGTYEIPVKINDVLQINFIFDSGASDVSISPDVALTLIRTGTVTSSDFIGSQRYSFADGSSATSKVFIIKKLQIGNQTLYNIKASISNSIHAPMLLGQSALSKLGKITIDNKNNLLVIE